MQGLVANIGYTHQWTPQWRTTIQAGYAAQYLGANAGIVGAGKVFGNTNNFSGQANTLAQTAGLPSTATNVVRTAWQAAGAVLWTPVNGFTVGLDLGVISASYYGHTASGVASGIGANRTGLYGMFHVTRTF